MPFVHIPPLIILAAAVAAWIVGGFYYAILGKAWMAALGKSAEELRPGGKMRLQPMIVSFIADGVIAIVLAGAMGHLGAEFVNLKDGIISAAILCVGFVIPTMATNNAFGQRSTLLTLIDTGHWLLAFIVAGAVIGAFGA